MGAALDDSPLLDDEDLVGAADGGETVGDDEGGAALHQLRQAGLDHGFRLGVERAGGFVEDEDARVGQNGAGDGKALALAAGELDAALADDGVVGFGEALGEFVDAGDAAGEQKVVFGGLGAGKHDVFADGAVEEECVLKNDAELRAEGVQVRPGRGRCRRPERWPCVGVWKAQMQADDGGLAGAGGADERGNGARIGDEAYAVEDGLVGLVGEFDVFETGRCRESGAWKTVRPATWFSSSSAMISLVRSRPANASVSWVPMFTI